MVSLTRTVKVRGVGEGEAFGKRRRNVGTGVSVLILTIHLETLYPILVDVKFCSFVNYRRHRTDLADDTSTVDITPSVPPPTHEAPRPASGWEKTQPAHPRGAKGRVDVGGSVSTSGPVGTRETLPGVGTSESSRTGVTDLWGRRTGGETKTSFQLRLESVTTLGRSTRTRVPPRLHGRETKGPGEV